MHQKQHFTGLTSIVAVGLRGEIGIENRLPWKLKSDLRFFKRTTLNNIVIMGRKTFDSVGGCLPKRENLILSHSASLFEAHDGCYHTHSVGETLWRRNKLPHKQAYVIGGAQTYEQFAPFVSRYLITVVESRFADADAFFNEAILGNDADWQHTELQVDRLPDANADEFCFSVYELTHRRAGEIEEACHNEIAAYERKNHMFRRKELQRRAHNGETLDQLRSIA